ncbi:MAG: hypothetical protein ACOVNY_06075 [Chitinophagaceae bacterium]
MKKYYLFIALLHVAFIVKAQLPEEGLRSAWFTGNGTARNIATGGVMGSLGGDITAAHVNPAGLGLFKTNEFVISPGFLLNQNKFGYRGKDTTNNRNSFVYGATGVIWGKPLRYKNSNGWVSNAFAISINQLASYRNRIQFSGFNNLSSFSEQYLEELIRDRADTNAALSNYIFGSSLAFRTYLIDTLRAANGSFDGYQSLVPLSTGVNQYYDAITSGGYHELAFSAAGNMEDKLYVGASITVPVIGFQRQLTYRETDATNNPNNQFESFTFSESFRSTGIGIGAKMGFIYKPKDFWRLGVAIHTPQLIGMRDELRASMVTNTESYAGVVAESSNDLNSGNAGKREYLMITPYRLIASASYVFREVSDTRKQRAFISADIEFVNYRGVRFSASDEFVDEGIKSYLRTLNETVKKVYKGNINARIGGELKLNVFMIRMGAAYFGSPYADKTLGANRILATGGFGYRNHGIFIDLSYAHNFVNDAQFAYRLNDKPNTFAKQQSNIGNIMLTLGFKF